MQVLRFSGKLGVNGQVVESTTVHWQCEQCGRTGSIRWGFFKNVEGPCRYCKIHGTLPTEQEAIAKYPCILAAVDTNRWGRIGTQNFVHVRCVMCGEEHDTRYANVIDKDGAWNCRSCAKLKQYGNDIVMPANLPDYVVGYDSSNLGSFGRIISQTIVQTRCPDCGELQNRPWSNVVAHGIVRCKACVTSSGWRGGLYAEHGEKIKALWQTEEFRKAALENRRDGGYISGLHADVKDYLNLFGMRQFKSEQLIGKFRVDEEDCENKVILEVYGDWWHCNPAKYNPGQQISRDGKLVLVSDIWKSNQERIDYFRSIGYAVYIIWESDFRADPERSIQDFAEWLDDLCSIQSRWAG